MTDIRPLDDFAVLRERVARVPSAALVGLSALAAAAFGLALPTHPIEALAVLCLVPLAFGAPLASLGVVLFVTVLVPFDLQNRVSVGGGPGAPGLLLVDVLLALGLCRVGLLLLARRLRLETPLVIAAALLVVLTAALLNGVVTGATASDAGVEARLPGLRRGRVRPGLAPPARRASAAPPVRGAARARSRPRPLGARPVGLHIPYSLAGDVGVRPGIDQIAAKGGGQLQGGLYAFPVAVILSFALLLSNRGRGGAIQALAATVFALNSVCVLLTYERTIWGAAAIGCLIVAVRSGRQSRRSAAKWVAIGVAGLLALSALSPGARTTTVDRITSVVQYRSDNAVLAREVESRAVIGAIRRHPFTGSGFGATITWGKTNVFATTTTSYTHNGYLWLAWKLGIPLALAHRRDRRGGRPAARATTSGVGAGHPADWQPVSADRPPARLRHVPGLQRARDHGGDGPAGGRMPLARSRVVVPTRRRALLRRRAARGRVGWTWAHRGDRRFDDRARRDGLHNGASRHDLGARSDHDRPDERRPGPHDHVLAQIRPAGHARWHPAQRRASRSATRCSQGPCEPRS